jgi:aspartate aminotransferase
MSYFDNVTKLPEDPILGLSIAFAADPRPNKVNLGVGAYRDAEGKPFVLSSVLKAERILLEKQLNKEYLPIKGDPDFLNSSVKQIFGEALQQRCNAQMFSIQALGGTGALRLGGEFLSQDSMRTIYIPDPSWLNHRRVFTHARMQVDTYPYYDSVRKCLDFPGLCAAIRKMPARSVILMHACCHNPTGFDPSIEQWKELSTLIKNQGILPFFDLAYAGLGQGFDEDIFPIRYFVEQGHELFCATSYSKMFGLYGERVGMLTIVSPHSDAIGSHLKVLARGCYSNPPLHGERIVTTILQSQSLRQEWLQELEGMRTRIQDQRQRLVSALISKGIESANELSKQQGMFAYTGLDQECLQRLCQEHAIYMADSGRINLAGLNAKNFVYVVAALKAEYSR